MDKNFEIADIIVAFIKNEATPRQISVLDDWINESEANKRLFISLLDEVAFEQRLSSPSMLEVEDAFGKVRARVRKSKRGYWRYVAVAASVAVVVAIGGIMAYWVGIPEKQGIVTRQQSISVGKSRAFLTLGTGEKVTLESQDTLLRGKAMNIRIQENGEVFYEMADSIAPAEVEYNIMETPRGAEFQLVLSDGTKVWLTAGTKLRYPVKFAGGERRVYLSGEAYFEVEHDAEAPFIVNTESMDLQVLGTSFNIKAYDDESMVITTLVTGKIRQEFPEVGKNITLTPSRQSIFDRVSGKLETHQADVQAVLAWKEGKIIANDERLEDIFRQLSRWYDFKVVYTQPSLKDVRFYLHSNRYAEVRTILEHLQTTKGIHFTYAENTIYVSQ